MTLTDFSLYFKVFVDFYGRTQPWVGGWGGIRTHGMLTHTPVFKTGAFNRSTTHPSLHKTSNWHRILQASFPSKLEARIL
jgi:hypothetical protein